MHVTSYEWKLIPLRGIVFIGVLLISTHYTQQTTLCVCFYRMKELTVLYQLYSYVAVNRGTVINNKQNECERWND